MEFLIAKESLFIMLPKGPSVLESVVNFDLEFIKNPRSLAAFESLRGMNTKKKWPSWLIKVTVKDDPRMAELCIDLDDDYILKDISKSLDIEHVTVQVTFSKLSLRLCGSNNAMNVRPSEVEISTKEMTVGITEGMKSCKDEFQFPADWRMDLFQKGGDNYLRQIFGKVDIKLTVHPLPGSKLEQQNSY